MSAYSFSQDPGNTYLLVTAMPGWKTLATWMAMGSDAVADINRAATVTV